MSGEPPIAGELAHLWEFWKRYMTGNAAHHKFLIVSGIFIFVCHSQMAEM